MALATAANKNTKTPKQSQTAMSTLKPHLSISLVLLPLILLFAACSTDSPVNPAEDLAQAQNCALEQAVMVEGLGDYGRDIHSNSTEAQSYFDQGLRLTFSYYFPEALASFNARFMR